MHTSTATGQVGSALTSSSSQAGKTRYLREIDGVRGLALTLVVLFHVFGDGRVSGGVDVFLVISAYLLTRKLWVRFVEHENSDTPEANITWLGRHFERVFVRLVPSATLVVAAILIATLLWTPASNQLQIISEAIASLLYFQNWELINSQLAYSAAGPASSPFQNFWSLSMQGQFFLVWPFVIWLLCVVCGRLKLVPKNLVVAAISVVTLSSFGYALYLTSFDQQVAYFNTFARIWEFGVGTLAVFIPGRIFGSVVLREFSIWSGLLMIASSGFIFDGAKLYPGLETLWPVLGTFLLLFGATREASPGPSRALLGSKAVAALARVSYQLFLWHWPVLVFYLAVRDREKIGLLGGVFVISISILLAILTERLTRGFSAPASSAIAMRSIRKVYWSLFLAVLGSALIWNLSAHAALARGLESLANLDARYPGARAFDSVSEPEPLSQVGDFAPSLDVAPKDQPAFLQLGCHQKYGNEPGFEAVKVCDQDTYGTNKTVVLTGGSYAVQWYPALQKIAQAQGWRLVVIHKSGCRLTTDSSVRACQLWNEDVIDVISSYQPDAVFTLGTVVRYHDEIEGLERGMIEQIATLGSRGIEVFGIRGTPKFSFDVPECLAQNNLDQNLCTRPRDRIFLSSYAQLQELIGLANFKLLDLTDSICESDVCRPIVGNVLVYRDDGHMTATYAQTLTGALELSIRQADPTFLSNSK
jgi:peptidoglycan/LPS O-acetylase OafA/YrhL